MSGRPSPRRRVDDVDDRWMDAAACLTADPDLFFPPSWTPAEVVAEMDAKAKAICADCAVFDECAAFARRNGEKHGTWAGVTESERAGARRSRRTQQRYASRDRQEARLRSAGLAHVRRVERRSLDDLCPRDALPVSAVVVLPGGVESERLCVGCAERAVRQLNMGGVDDGEV